MRLLGRYRDSQGADFRLGAFHDQLISYGTLPLSVIEWLMFDDENSLARGAEVAGFAIESAMRTHGQPAVVSGVVFAHKQSELSISVVISGQGPALMPAEWSSGSLCQRHNCSRPRLSVVRMADSIAKFRLLQRLAQRSSVIVIISIRITDRVRL